MSQRATMTPQRDSWTKELLGPNPPRLVRLQRLRALAKASDVQPGFEAVGSGAFISLADWLKQVGIKSVAMESTGGSTRSSRRPERYAGGW